MQIDSRKTALVLIDLQKGIVPMAFAPRPATAVVATAKDVARRFRAAGAPIVVVTVDWAKGFEDALSQPVDQAMGGEALPPDWGEPVDGLMQEGDIRIVKRQWGAFYGTELDLQLRRRGIDTIVLGGVATNYGVESTARSAWEHGYNLILVEDMTASFTADLHHFGFEKVFAHIGQVASAADLDLIGT